ncbi:hypothetical protein TSUD_302810 [Trifolium subterraneum]|uniref:Uncharacterized protein n=1 Tax=Trifolium subterraneum TaxID=3900 RepID=A0A2Z6NVF4_TRISU|nr:hypothetical protein TSUD_302810 [Trifolium subterraneum]
MFRSIVPSSRTRGSNLIDHPRITSLAPTNQPNMEFGINMMGNMTNCDFYIPDAAGDTTLVPGFRNSVEEALHGIGIRPHFVSLPSQAQEHRIVISDLPEFEWPSILTMFGYYILVLFKIDSELFGTGSYPYSPLAKRVDELKAKVGCCHRKYLGIPLTEEVENSIRIMLGTHALRTFVINFLINNSNHPDPKSCSLFHYLNYVLSWSGDLRVCSLFMYERLVKTKSPVLADYRVKAEVDNLEETIKAIVSHTYPQYFNHLCLVSELLYLDVSRFPTLFAVALELEMKATGHHHYSPHISKADSTTVRELVNLHRTAMAQDQVTTVRRMPSVPGI